MVWEIEIPKTCPECETPLEIRNGQLFCNNKNCPARTSGKLKHFSKTLDIKGLGQATIEKLELNTITDIYDLTKDGIIDIIGEALGTKLYGEIEKSKFVPFALFLAALNIPLVGKETADKLTAKMKEYNDKELLLACETPKLRESVAHWLESNSLEEYKPYFSFSAGSGISADTAVCISGKCGGYTREQLKKLLVGYKVQDNVTKQTKFLIVGDTNLSNDKVNKARMYNVEIIKFDDFLERYL